MGFKEYDAIVSLGGFCGASIQLRARGLRPYSLPFDWLFMEDEQSIKWLTSEVGNDFRSFCLRENLVAIDRADVGGMAPFKYKDVLSGYGFVHHFRKDKEAGGYEEAKIVMDRRMRRFFSIFTPGKSVLLILSTLFEFDYGLAEDLLRAFRVRFPDTMIDLHVIQLGCAFDNTLTLAERVPDSLPFTGCRVARMQDYDLHYTSSEWSFLDGLALTDYPRKKLKGISKLKFKIWKGLSKWLRNEGYGCLGVRFYG